MWLECYRAAAQIEDAESHYVIRKNLLEEAKFRQSLQNQGIFANTSNEKQMQQLFEEAHAYLNAAESLNHIQAKRLKGLTYINAGV